MAKKPTRSALPSKQQILDFVNQTDGKVGKREIGRAFQIRSQDRIELKKILREMRDEGLLEKGYKKAMHKPGRLPNIAVIEITGIDRHGDLIAAPVSWEHEDAPPKIHILPQKNRKGGPAPGRGDRVLARLEYISDTSYSGRIIRVLQSANLTILGIFRSSGEQDRLIPVDKKVREEFLITGGGREKPKDGDLVLAEVLDRRRANRPMGLRRVKLKEIIGDMSAPKSVSLIAIHAHGIPHDFSAGAVREAEAAKPVTLGKREDLRDIPLITIDPPDARDHDDAIFAEPDPDPKNPGGWHVIVAIADVAHYVRHASALDKDARIRGNSCYFPDRVVPMLPEALSADLCSLKPGVDRAALAVHMWFDVEGNKKRHRFCRALMRSAANMAYRDVQAAFDKGEGALIDTVIRPLYGAYEAIRIARTKREPLDLELPERKIILDDQGNVTDITIQERLDAHKLVEEFMIQANVAAAEALEARRTPCMYRVHEEPGLEKLEELRDFLKSLNLSLAKGQVLKPRAFNQILRKVVGAPHQLLVNDVVLRSQTQAYYSPANAGHFGLALPKYAHFTSPIRRYADVLIHRGLIRAYGLGEDGLRDDEASELEELGALISTTERRAMVAERDSKDRYVAAFLSNRVGETFKGRISGVTKFGLFVTLEPWGGDGLIPMARLTDDFYIYDQTHHTLIGRSTKRRFQLGDPIEVRLSDTRPTSGGLELELLDRMKTTARTKKHGGKKIKQRKYKGKQRK